MRYDRQTAARPAAPDAASAPGQAGTARLPGGDGRRQPRRAAADNGNGFVFEKCAVTRCTVRDAHAGEFLFTRYI